MLVEVQKGIVDTDKILTMSPVITDNDGQQADGTVALDKIRYVFQVTLTHGAQITCFYKTKDEAECERGFLLQQWMLTLKQSDIPKLDKGQKGVK